MKEDNSEYEKDIEDVVDVFYGEERLLVYGFYAQLDIHKSYASQMQNRYRSLTSTWLLAAFAGMGYLLSGHVNIQLPFDVLLGIILLCVCSSFGITLLWFLDVVLHQRLWLGTIVELARLESKYSWLPKSNINLLLIRKSKRFRFLQSYFYIGINGIFVLISSLVLIYYFWNQPKIASSIPLIGIAVYTLISRLMVKYSGEVDEVTIRSFQ